MDSRVLKAYLDHFLPREVIGPVVVVFSLEGVIEGLFSAYVPAAYTTLGWGVVFLLAIVGIGYWGSVDEPDVEELHERLEEIEEERAESSLDTSEDDDAGLQDGQ